MKSFVTFYCVKSQTCKTKSGWSTILITIYISWVTTCTGITNETKIVLQRIGWLLKMLSGFEWSDGTLNRWRSLGPLHCKENRLNSNVACDHLIQKCIEDEALTSRRGRNGNEQLRCFVEWRDEVNNDSFDRNYSFRICCTERVKSLQSTSIEIMLNWTMCTHR